MINIAICDDDLPTTELIERLILDNQKYFPEKIIVSIFFSGESFSKSIENGCPFDIIFMDIEMKKVNGIEAGQKLRVDNENDIVHIIYVSSYEKYHLKLFDVQPSGFIKKPICKDIFNNKLNSIIKKVLNKKAQGKINFLSVEKKGKTILIPFRDIIYFESKTRMIFLFTSKEEINYYSKLNEEEKKLIGNNFIRIHQSYIVNFYFVKEIFANKVVLVNKKELPISEKKSHFVKMSYLKFRRSIVG